MMFNESNRLGVDVRASTNKRVLQADITSVLYGAARRLTAQAFGILGIPVFVIWDAGDLEALKTRV